MNDDQKLLAQVAPAANMQAGAIAAELLLHELAQKLAANMVLAGELQRVRSAMAATNGHLDQAITAAKAAQQSGAVARAKLDVTHDFLAGVFGHKGEDKPDLETLLNRARAASEALDGLENFRAAVRDLVDEGEVLAPGTCATMADSDLLATLEAVMKGPRGGDPVIIDWGVVTRLRAVMGHMRGNRLPSAISLLDAVIDELVNEIEPPRPENEAEMAEATAADRKIKEDKEDFEPAM